MENSRLIDVVAAAIIRDNKVLVAQRNARQNHPLQWEFPGGKLEAGETHEEALGRELFEELGIRAHVLGHIATHTQRGEDVLFKLHLYRCSIEDREIIAFEHEAVAWLGFEELASLDLTAGDRELLPQLESQIQAIPSVWEQSANELDELPLKAKGPHLMSAIQRPWTYVNENFNLGKAALNVLETTYDCSRLKVVRQLQSSDKTTRFIFAAADSAQFECIHMPRELKTSRVTLCVSSQAGCAMNCAFCATARLGLRRNLLAHEIISQILQAIEYLGPNKSHAINIVYMGMGEPLMNTEEVMKSIQILCHQDGLRIPDKRITVSTCGVLSELSKILDYPYRPNIAISLNASNDETRSKLMPINRKYPLSQIRETLLRWPYRSHEKILLEYVLIHKINDSLEDAKRLAAFAKGIRHNINIIPYNQARSCDFAAPPSEEVQGFIKVLQDEGCLVTLRQGRGVEVGGACGQLLAK